MAITPLPTPPSRNDPTNFSSRGDAFLGALPTFATEANALAVDVNADAVLAAASAVDAEDAVTAAEAAAAAAAAAANVTKWISGTTYAEGVVVWSPITYLSYRRKTAGAGTTDPSADSTNWAQAAGTGDVTLTGTQTLTNKTLGTGTLFAATINGQDNNLTRVELQDYGYAYFDSNTTSALNFTNGSHQRWAPTAASNPTFSITNFAPSGNLSELFVEAVNLGAAGTITFPTINWVRYDGAFSASPSAAGVTFQTSGLDFILFWTRDGGTTIYAKVVR